MSPLRFAINLTRFLACMVWSGVWITAALVILLLTWRPQIPLTMARTIWGPGILWLAGGTLECRLDEEIDWDQPHIFVCNHQSMLDIPSAFVALRAPLRFVAKRSLERIPFLGWYMRATGMVFVERGNPVEARRSVALAGQRVREGHGSLLVFPEGTRSKDGKIHAFKKGPFALALEAGVPLVPVAIEGSRHVMHPRGLGGHPGTIVVRVGRPIPTSDLDPSDRGALARLTRAKMIELHRSIGGPSTHDDHLDGDAAQARRGHA